MSPGRGAQLCSLLMNILSTMILTLPYQATDAGHLENLANSWWSRADALTQEILHKYREEPSANVRFDDLDQLFVDPYNLWYSYNSSAVSREELRVINVTEDHVKTLSLVEYSVSKWVAHKIGRRIFMIGTTNNSIVQVAITPDAPLRGRETALSSHLVASSSISYYNGRTRSQEVLVALVVNPQEPVLVWYRLEDDNLVLVPSNWLLHRSVKKIQLFQQDGDLRLMVLPDVAGGDDSYNQETTMAIMDVTVLKNKIDMWLSETVLAGHPVDAKVFQAGERCFLAVSDLAKQEVTVHQASKSKFEILQQIPGIQVDRLQHFRVGFRHHLLLERYSPEANASLLLLSSTGEKFLPLQDLSLKDVVAWVPLPIDAHRDEVLLIGQRRRKNNGAKFHFFSWNAGQRRFVHQHLPCSDGTSANCIIGVSPILEGAAMVTGCDLILLPMLGSSTRVLKIDWILEELQDPVREESKRLLQAYMLMKKDEEEQMNVVQNIKNVLHDAIDTNSANVVSAQWNVTGEIVAKEVEVSGTDQLEMDSVKYLGLDWTPGDTATNLSYIESLLVELENNIKVLEGALSDAVYLDDPHTVIDAQKKITGLVKATAGAINTLDVQYINGMDINELLNSIVTTDASNIDLEGHKTFTSPAYIQNLNVETINGMKPEDLVKTNAPVEINGEVTYHHQLKVLGSVILPDGTQVNGVDLSREVSHIGSDIGSQTFEDIIAETVTVDGFVDGINITNEVNNLLTKSTVQDISGKLKVNHVIINGDVQVGTLNEQDVTDLVKNIIRVDTDYNQIIGIKYLTGLNANLIDHLQHLNGLHFPNDYVRTMSPSIISAHHYFSIMNVNNASVDGLVDGIDLDNDVITISTPQVLSGHHIFTKEILVKKNLKVLGPVDGIDVADLMHKGLLNETVEEHYINSDVTFVGNVDINEIIIEEELNDELVEELFNSVLYDDLPEATISGLTTFNEGLILGDTTITGLLNGLNVSDIVSTNSDHTVRGEKTFASGISANKMSVLGLIGGVNLTDLSQKAVRITGDSKIDSHLHFENVSAEFIEITSPINSVTFWEMAAKLGPKEVTKGDVTMDNIHLEWLEVEHDVDATSLNEVDLSDWVNRRVNLAGEQTLQSHYSFDSLEITGDLETPLIDGLSLPQLDQFSLKKHKDHQIFTGTVSQSTINVTGDVTTTWGINGFNLSAVAQDAVWIERNNYISGKMEFTSQLIIKNATVHGLVSGVDVRELDSDIARRGKHIHLGGVKKFSSVYVMGDINATTLNGKNFKKTLLTTNTDQEITAPYHMGDVIVTDDLHVQGRINDVDIPTLTKRYSWENGINIIHGDMSFIGSVTTGTLTVNGTISDVDWSEFLAQSIYKDQYAVVQGKKTFIGEVVLNNASLAGLYNGINLLALASNVALVDQTSKIEGTIQFTSDITASRLMVLGNLDTGLLTGLNVTQMSLEAVYLDGTQSVLGVKQFGHINVAGDVTVAELNEIQLQDVVTLTTNQSLENIKIGDLTLVSDVRVGGMVNGFNLMEEYQDTLLSHGYQTVTGPKMFSGEVIIDGNLSLGTLNGYKTSELVTLNTEQILPGTMNFHNVALSGDLASGLTNNINLTSLSQLLLSKTQSQTIFGSWTLLGPVEFADNVTGKSLLDGVDLDELAGSLEWGLNGINADLKAIRDNYFTHCKATNLLSQHMENSVYRLDYFDDLQTLTLTQDVVGMHHFRYEESDHLLVSLANCTTIQYSWDETRLSFFPASRPQLGSVMKWQTFTDYGATYLVTLGNSTCNPSGVSVWILQDWSTFEFYQKVEDLGQPKSIAVISYRGATFLFIATSSKLSQWTWTDGKFELKYNITGTFNEINTLVVGDSAYIATSGNEYLSIWTADGMILLQNRIYKHQLNQFAIMAVDNQVLAATTSRQEMTGLCNTIQLWKNVTDDPSILHDIVVSNPTSVGAFSIGTGQSSTTFLFSIELDWGVHLHRYSGMSGFISHQQLPILGAINVAHFKLGVGESVQPVPLLAVARRGGYVDILLAKMIGDTLTQTNLPPCKEPGKLKPRNGY